MSDRDGYCTPAWLTALLPEVDLDPCSNPRSTVHARRTYSLEAGQDGLSLPWDCSVFVNPPYSDVRPWASKLLTQDARHAAAFLVNVDSSTVWWSLLTERLVYALLFRDRVQFTPPPGVATSTNSKPQALLMNGRFIGMCPAELLRKGLVWSTPTVIPEMQPYA